MIEKLERLVRTLNHEKEQYRKQIRDLQSECPLLFLPCFYLVTFLSSVPLFCHLRKREALVSILLYFFRLQSKATEVVITGTLFKIILAFVAHFHWLGWHCLSQNRGGLMQNVCMKVSETRCISWPSLLPSHPSFLHYTLFLHGGFQVKWGTSA